MTIQDRQVLLAHTSSETTKIYTHPNAELAERYLDGLTNYLGTTKQGKSTTSVQIYGDVDWRLQSNLIYLAFGTPRISSHLLSSELQPVQL